MEDDDASDFGYGNAPYLSYLFDNDDLVFAYYYFAIRENTGHMPTGIPPDVIVRAHHNNKRTVFGPPKPRKKRKKLDHIGALVDIRAQSTHGQSISGPF